MSYDRQHRQPGSQPKAAPATVVGAAFTYPLDKFAPISGSTEVIAAAAAEGISRSTLRQARIELNVRLERVPGVGARHLWSSSACYTGVVPA